MDITLYTDLTACEALVLEKTGLAPSDLATLLQIYAGKRGETTVYRPYFVAAWLLSTRKTQIEAAEGAEFVDPLAVAKEYLAMQRTIDSTLQLTVPLGAEAAQVSLSRAGAAMGSGHVDVVGRW